MCNQRRSNVKSTKTGGNNVTQQQKRQSRNGAGNKPKGTTEGCSGNVTGTTTTAGRKPRNSRPLGSGSVAARQPRTGRSGAPLKKGNKAVQLQLPGTVNNGATGSGNSQTGVSRHNSEDRHFYVRNRVWKASEVCTRLRKDGAIQGKFKVDQELVLVTTWAALFEDLCPVGLQAFRDSIVDYGLVGTIIRFQRIASTLINDSTPAVLDTNFVSVLKSLPLKDALQLMRFGKRYTPLAWDSDMERSIYASFHARNNRAKLFNRRGIPQWLVKRLQYIGRKLCKAAIGRKQLDNFVGYRSYLGDLGHLPSGTTAEGLRNPFEKWLYVSALWNQLDPFTQDAIPTNDIGTRDVYSKVVMVPKDYRGPRIIMEELLETTLQQSMIADAVMKVIKCDNKASMPFSASHAIQLDDQSQNQDMARLGAMFGYYSTLDLKDASDSITAALIYAVFPYEFAELIMSHATVKTELPNGKVCDLHMPCTMGSRMTVPVQSLIYWVIICVAVDILVDLGVLDDHSILSDCSVYNDDIIVPYMLYDTVSDLLQLCGLIVNHDKSYTDDHPFRESCGVDAYNDDVVTSAYWPRKALDIANDELPSLCALQNRLFDLGAHKAASVVESYVRLICPKVPYVAPDSESIGLYTPIPPVQASPYICNDVSADSSSNWYIEFVEYPWRHVNNDPNLVIENTKLVVRKARPQAKRFTVSLRTFGDLLPYAHELKDKCPWANSIEIIHDYLRSDTEVIDLADVLNGANIIHTPLLRDKRKITLADVFRIHESTIIQTYDNRMIGKLRLDGLSRDQIAANFERFEYERWLLQGSEYYDDWCEVLHVTQPSRLRNRLYVSGYKVGNNTFTYVNINK